MMTLYELVRDRADVQSVSVSHSDIERIVGTLRVAGIPRQVDARYINTAVGITDDELRRTAAMATRTRTASTKGNVAQQVTSQGVCPKCKTAMETVKLSDYSNALYCKSCRATLW